MINNLKHSLKSQIKAFEGIFDYFFNPLSVPTNGILYSDNSKKRAYHFNKLSRNDGLPSNNIQFIVEDLHQNILVLVPIHIVLCESSKIFFAFISETLV